MSSRHCQTVYSPRLPSLKQQHNNMRSLFRAREGLKWARRIAEGTTENFMNAGPKFWYGNVQAPLCGGSSNLLSCFSALLQQPGYYLLAGSKPRSSEGPRQTKPGQRARASAWRQQKEWAVMKACCWHGHMYQLLPQ